MSSSISYPARIGFALLVGIALFSVLAAAKEVIPVGDLSVSQIEEELQVCIYPRSFRISHIRVLVLLCLSDQLDQA